MPDIKTFCRVCEPACGLVATAAEQFVEREAEPPGQLRLITKRDRFMHNSWLHGSHH